MATITTTPNRHRTGVLLLACLVLFVDGYDLFTLGTIGPSLLRDRSWGASVTTLGTLGSLTALGMPVGSILAGWAADRWSRRIPLVVAVCWISASMLAAAAAQDLTQLGAARVGTGIGVGALAPLVAALVSDHAPRNRRTLHLAVAMGSIGIGGTASALLGRVLLSEVHFQTLFLIGAFPVVLVPLILWIVPSTTPHSGHTQRNRHVAELFTPSTRIATVLFWIATFASMSLVYSTTAWLPTVMMRNGYSLNSSLEFMIAFTAGAACGGVLMAILADRGHLKIVTAVTFSLAAIALLVLSTNQPRPLLLAISALAGLGSLGCQNLVIAYISAYYPPRLRATALGFGLGVGRLGAIAGPSYLSAATAFFTSPRAGFFAFMAPALLGAITVTLLPAPDTHAVSDPEAAAPLPLEQNTNR
ncbi:MFS transporter [Nocardia sp. XZ_19_385]|uniref:MFS transporter n=1 Tax=Nocardia sp. XZ_19_385 TaxID=2769488 RepID=UPI00188E9DE9|nr:MFS transporter [Nocardia sp. XZ_19_385]